MRCLMSLCLDYTTGWETPVVEEKKSNPFNLNKWAISCFLISGGLFAQVLGVTYFIENLLWLVHVMAKLVSELVKKWFWLE